MKAVRPIIVTNGVPHLEIMQFVRLKSVLLGIAHFVLPIRIVADVFSAIRVLSCLLSSLTFIFTNVSLLSLSRYFIRSFSISRLSSCVAEFIRALCYPSNSRFTVQILRRWISFFFRT